MAGPEYGYATSPLPQGQATGAGPGTSPAAPGWFNAFATVSNRVEELCSRINGAVDTFVGAIPQPAGDAKVGPSAAGGMFGDLEGLLTQLDQRVSYALRQVQRLTTQIPPGSSK